jgi:hypothetical protein
MVHVLEALLVLITLWSWCNNTYDPCAHNPYSTYGPRVDEFYNPCSPGFCNSYKNYIPYNLMLVTFYVPCINNPYKP